MSTLPKTLDLLKTSWEQYKTHWNELIHVSIWMLWIYVIQALVGVLTQQHQRYALLSVLFVIVIVPLSILISARLILATLSVSRGHAVDSDTDLWKKARAAFWPLVWIAILQIICILGGTILLIIPGIYLSLALTFSSMTLLDQDKHGSKALSTSLDLVRGRWWGTWWRMFAGMFCILVPTMIVSAILFSVLTAIAGVGNAPVNHPLILAAENLFQGAMQTVIVPLAILFEVHVYQALKK